MLTDMGRKLPDDSALSEWPVLAEAAVLRSNSERCILVGSCLLRVAAETAGSCPWHFVTRRSGASQEADIPLDFGRVTSIGAAREPRPG